MELSSECHLHPRAAKQQLFAIKVPIRVLLPVSDSRFLADLSSEQAQPESGDSRQATSSMRFTVA